MRHGYEAQAWRGRVGAYKGIAGRLRAEGDRQFSAFRKTSGGRQGRTCETCYEADSTGAFAVGVLGGLEARVVGIGFAFVGVARGAVEECVGG